MDGFHNKLIFCLCLFAKMSQKSLVPRLWSNPVAGDKNEWDEKNEWPEKPDVLHNATWTRKPFAPVKSRLEFHLFVQNTLRRPFRKF